MFDFIVGFISESGYIGIFGLMALENIFPPIPSELIMPLAGFTVARGDLNLAGVLLAGTAGSVAGALPWYYAGKMYGQERLKEVSARHGRWLTVSPKEIDGALVAFDKHGRKAVFLGRLAPAIRTLISVPAGIARMSLLPFLAFSTAGSLIWCSLLTGAGSVLEDNYQKVSTYLDPVSKGILALIITAYLFRLMTYRPEKT
jgi:membrane protein DedA with SNARE-associated domain